MDTPIFISISKDVDREVKNLIDILRRGDVEVYVTEDIERNGGITVISFPAVYSDEEAVIYLRNLVKKIQREKSTGKQTPSVSRGG